MGINRPALRYHGGKWKLGKWIIEQFPEHDCYVEPFGGGGSVLLQKERSYVEVYNDINKLVVNFFRVLREKPDELINAIELTPYSRQEFIESQEYVDDPVELARRFYIWSWQGRGRGGVVEKGAWRFMSRNTRKKTPSDDWCNNQHLWLVVQRLKRVQIECDDALKVIKRFDDKNTLFYVDPPYVPETRGSRWSKTAYANDYTVDDHVRLADVLHSVEGKVILSGYHSGLYDGLYGDWEQIEKQGEKDSTVGERKTIECLWMKNIVQRQCTLFN